jgi:hypothetical protein
VKEAAKIAATWRTRLMSALQPNSADYIGCSVQGVRVDLEPLPGGYSIPDDPQHRQAAASMGPFIASPQLVPLQLTLVPPGHK